MRRRGQTGGSWRTSRICWGRCYEGRGCVRRGGELGSGGSGQKDFPPMPPMPVRRYFFKPPGWAWMAAAALLAAACATGGATGKVAAAATTPRVALGIDVLQEG